MSARAWLARAAAAACLTAMALAPPAAAQHRAGARCAAGERYEACLQRALRASSEALRTAGGERPRAVAELLEDVCAHGLGDGCYFAGRLRLTALDPRADSVARGAAQRQAAALFVRGCDAARSRRGPSAAACASAGDAFAYTLGTVANADSAYAYYQRGCTLGYATACAREAAHLARRYDEGPARTRAAEERSAAACRGDSPSGCVEAAVFGLQRLRGVPAARRTAAHARQVRAMLRELRVLCNDGFYLPRACTTLGAAYADRALGATLNADSARRYFRAGCQGRVGGRDAGPGAWLGDGAACRGVAALATGDSSGRAEALLFYRAGCMLYDAESCVEQGGREPAAGTGTEAAYRRIILFASSCLGTPPSGAGCRAAAEAFRHALRDTARAATFFRRACGLGDAAGCMALAVEEEDTVRGEPAAAVKHYRLACQLGDGGGCAGLSRLLGGLYRDPERARRLLERGCGLGSARACWELARSRDPVADEEEVARDRAAACRYDRSYCKRGGAQP